MAFHAARGVELTADQVLRSLIVGTSIAVAVLLIAAVGASAQRSPAYPDPSGYCVPENLHHDPPDVRRPNVPPIELPPGFTRRRVTVAGFSTPVIEAGPRDGREAVVFMHGNPGSSVDFLGILRSVPSGTRVIAFDMLGFGQASKPYGFSYTLEASRPLFDRALAELGVERVHLVGHDIGSVVGVDWAARHPRQLASAVLIAGGILIGYTDHHFARVWQTPVAGEDSMRRANRQGFVTLIQAHNPRPLPREFLERNYDDYDRATRCAILKAYRGMPDVDKLAREHARALRPYDRPALVIWGDRDPFLPQHIAQSNREGFPHADIRVYANSGHWPFVDEEQRTAGLMRSFFERHVGRRTAQRMRLSVRPRRVRAGRRVRFRFAVRSGSASCRRGVTIRFAGKRVRTNRRGRAKVSTRLRRARRYRARAAKRGCPSARAAARAVRPSKRR